MLNQGLIILNDKTKSKKMWSSELSNFEFTLFDRWQGDKMSTIIIIITIYFINFKLLYNISGHSILI